MGRGVEEGVGDGGMRKGWGGHFLKREWGCRWGSGVMQVLCISPNRVHSYSRSIHAYTKRTALCEMSRAGARLLCLLGIALPDASSLVSVWQQYDALE